MIGKTISHYRILEKIGGGGMGVVYKAEDTKLRRTVALKFLAPELTRDEDAKKRFVHEAQAASALDHPNICSIFDIDETPEGQLFIAMACYEGESLKDRIARRKVEVREAFEIAYSVAQGLARAHASGIIHRDIKPGNIMITSDGFVKIVDFGLAKLIGRSRITGSGATLGTIAYMSPEQARSDDSDARADIWALGVVLYEMLTGRLPFRGEIDQAVVYSILNEAPVPVRELRGDVPEECAAVVAKCLHKEPEGRYQSALEFCAELVDTSARLGWTSFSTGAVRAVSVVSGRARRRRNRVAWTVGGAAIAIAAVAAWYRWDRDSIYTTENRVAVMPFERVGDSPSRALVDGLWLCTASAVDAIGSVDESTWVVPYHRVINDRLGSMDRAAAAFGVNRLLRGHVVAFGDGYRLTLSLLDADAMRPLRDAAVDFRATELATLRDSISAALQELLGLAVHAGPSLLTGLEHATEAPAYLEGLGLLVNWRAADNAMQARDRLQPASGDSVSPPARAALGYAEFACFRKSQEAARPDSSRLEVAERWLRASSSDAVRLPEASLWLSYAYLRMGRGQDRISVLEAAVRDAPGSVMLREELGWAYADEQRYDEAEAVFRELTRREPDYSQGHWSLGWVYWRTGRRDREYAANERAYALAPGSYRVLNSLGLYFDAEGDLPRARDFFQRAFLAEPNCASCSNVGRVLYFEGRYKESARYYEYALDYCDTTLYAYWANLAGSLYYVDGERARAEALYRRAIGLARARLDEVPDDTETAAMLADFYSMIGDRENAFAMLDQTAGTTDARATFRIAQVYEHFGERTQALSYMDRALQLDMPIHEVVNEPMVSDLLKDPRFVKMLEAARAQSEQGDS